MVKSVHYMAPSEKSDSDTLVPVRIVKSIPLVAYDQVSSLGQDDRDYASSQVEQQDPGKYTYALQGNIMSAVWQDGVCKLTIKDGKMASYAEGQSEGVNLDKEVTVDGDGISEQAQCEGMAGRSVSMDSVMVDASSKSIVNNGNMAFGEQKWEDMSDEEKASFEKNLRNRVDESDVTYFGNENFPYAYDNTNKKWIGLNGNEVSDEEAKKLETMKIENIDGEGSFVYEEGSEEPYKLSDEDYAARMNEIRSNKASAEDKDLFDAVSQRIRKAVFGDEAKSSPEETTSIQKIDNTDKEVAKDNGDKGKSNIEEQSARIVDTSSEQEAQPEATKKNGKTWKEVMDEYRAKSLANARPFESFGKTVETTVRKGPAGLATTNE